MAGCRSDCPPEDDNNFNIFKKFKFSAIIKLVQNSWRGAGVVERARLEIGFPSFWEREFESHPRRQIKKQADGYCF